MILRILREYRFQELINNYQPKKQTTMRTFTAILILIFFSVNCDGVEELTFEYTAGDNDLDGVLTSVDINMEETSETLCLEVNEELLPAQAERLSSTRARIWWKANQPAGETVEYTVHTDRECANTEYSWVRTGDHSIQLQYNGQPLIQYEHPVYNPDNIEETKKPFHHVFDPVTGELITKGPGGLYSHHRGIFYGYNQIEIAGRVLDTWHAEDGERTEHVEFEEEFAGPVKGGHVAKISWNDQEGELMLEELRDVRAFKHTDDSFFIDFHIRVFAIAAPARLGGDLQHAGVQFRAAQYVADHADETRFIRPEEWAHLPADEELGEEDRINLPWNAMQFNIEDNPYTVVYMSHPWNPGRRAEMSERTYGRFGEFFPHQMSEGAPFELRYRFWVIAGESPSVDDIQRQYEIYTN